ncbi:MAG: metallophosphoesterase, partial [Eubacteriales bacterium]
ALAYAGRMKKRLIVLTLFCLMLGVCFLPAGQPAHAEETASPKLSFGDDGTFTVLVLADLQDTQFTTELVVSGETHVIAEYPADLIVLLGDQLEGWSPVLRLGNDAANVEKTLRTLLAPVEASGIPFAVIFGNHDYEAPLAIARQVEIYESYANCVGVSYGRNGGDDGAFVLPVYMTNSDMPAMALYFFDSGSYIANGDYDTVSAEQVAWYIQQSAAFRAANSGQALPSVAFCHIPVPEVYELMIEVPKGTADAFKGVGIGEGKYYLPDESKIFTGEVNEAPCPSSVNHGLFDAFLANDDVFLAINGHDHINSFIGSVKGVDIANAPGSSYTSYGQQGIRGARLFRFTEFNVRDYETLHAPYSNYDTPASYGYLKYFFSTSTGIYNALKIPLLVLLLIVALVATLVVRARKKTQSKDGSKITQTKNPPYGGFLFACISALLRVVQFRLGGCGGLSSGSDS